MGKKISLTASDGSVCEAYRADPAGDVRGGVVICQEIFGVNSHIQGVCDGFAQAGYLAVAPALFDRVRNGVDFGYSQDDLQAGLEIMRQIDLNDALKDVEAAAEVASEAGKTGVVGYCWGGTVAWVAATRLTRFSASVCYYGGGIGGLADEAPNCPVSLHFGAQDQSIPMNVVEDFRARHEDLPVFIYDAGHGFNCDQRGSYDAESAKLALERTQSFLATHLS